MSTKPLKIVVAPMDSAGHIYPCIGLAQALAKRGHTVELLLNEHFVDQFAPFGFKIIVLRRSNPETETKVNGEGQEVVLKKSPVKGMAELLFSIGVIGPGTPLEKLQRATVNQTAYLERYFADGVDYHPQLEAYFRSEKPDLVLIDNFLLPPSLHQAALPYVFIHSGNPLALYKSDRLPPLRGGYPTNSDPASWAEFIRLTEEKRAPTKDYQDRLYTRFGYDPAEADSEKAKSRRLDIYGYPEELDYADIAPRPKHLLRVDAFSYEAPKSESDSVSSFKLPKGFVNPGDRLIYLSLGSMCSVDVEIMKKILSALAKVPRVKVIVSKGQRSDEYDLPANAWGERFFPSQTAILPLVDLVITHGGNNTITETFSYGKPMIAMGFFSDQGDNSQRIQEKGYGLRLEPYEFTESQLIQAVERLLGDEEVKKRAKSAAERIARANSKDLAAKAIEQFVAKLKKKVSD